MRHKAMLNHYLRSLDDEREYEAWGSGKYVIPADEDRYLRSFKFGSKTLIERGRTNNEFSSILRELGVDPFSCRNCGQPSITDIYSYRYCIECADTIREEWDKAMAATRV